MAWKLSNWPDSTLIQALALAATTAYIDADDVDLLPTLGAGDKAKLVIFNASYREIVNITAWSTDGTLTIERAQEGTVARDWAAGTRVVHTPTAEIIQTVLNSVGAVIFEGTATGTNAYTVNVGASNPLPTFADGERVSFIIPNTNTSAAAPTLAVTDGTTTIAAKPIMHQADVAPEAGDLQANWLAVVQYNAAADDWFLISTTSNQLHATQINDGPVPGVNRHPNGKLDFWRGGTTFNTPASETETADGWYPVYDGTIGAFTISRQAFTLGQTDVPGDPKYFLRWDHSSAGSGSTLRRLRVPLPGVHWRNGEQVTRRVYLKADSARNVTRKILQNFGTSGGPSAEVEASTAVIALTTSWQAFDVTFTLPSVAGKTLGSDGNDCIYLTLDLPLNTTMTIDVACDDFRPGAFTGLQSDSYPVPWWLGGTSGSYGSQADFISDLALLTTTAFAAYFTTNYPDLDVVEALAGTSGLLAKTAANTWALRQLAVGTGLSVANPAGVAGDPTVSLGTALSNYVTDPLSVAELASITGTFGTAAFTAATAYAASTVTLTAGLGISGGGDLSANRSFAFDPTELTDVAIVTADSLVFLDATDSAPKRRLVSSLTTDLGIALLAGATFTGAVIHPSGSVGSPSCAIGTSDNGFYLIGTDNVGWSVNGVLGMDMSTTRVQMGVGMDLVLPVTMHAPTSVYSAGYRGSPVLSGNAAVAFPLAEAGGTYYHDEAGTRTYTIPANGSVAHPIGTFFIIDNTGNSGAAGAITLAITTDTLRRGDGTSGTGSRTISAGQVATIRKVASTIWIITGSFT